MSKHITTKIIQSMSYHKDQTQAKITIARNVNMKLGRRRKQWMGYNVGMNVSLFSNFSYRTNENPNVGALRTEDLVRPCRNPEVCKNDLQATKKEGDFSKTFRPALVSSWPQVV